MIPAPPLLFSYAYRRQCGAVALALARRGLTDVMIDSGAFTAHRLGHPVQLPEYNAFCRAFLGQPGTWGCVQLDVIGQSSGTRRNLKLMQQAGVTPMPVMTVDMPLAAAAELAAVNPRLCVAGGLGQFKDCRAWILQRYLNIHAYLGGACQLHGLGFVRWPDMFRCGLATGDSSSHNLGGRYGGLTWFDPSGGVRVINQKQFMAAPAKYPHYCRYLAACGVTRAQLERADLRRGHVSFSWLASSFAYARQACAAARRGFKTFLAVPSEAHLSLIGAVLAEGAGDGSRFDYWRARATVEKILRRPREQRTAAIVELFEAAHAHHQRDLSIDGRGLSSLAGRAAGT